MPDRQTGVPRPTWATSNGEDQNGKGHPRRSDYQAASPRSMRESLMPSKLHQETSAPPQHAARRNSPGMRSLFGESSDDESIQPPIQKIIPWQEDEEAALLEVYAEKKSLPNRLSLTSHASRMTCVEFWELISLKLARKGFHRSGPACSRHWHIVDKRSGGNPNEEEESRPRATTISWSDEETRFFLSNHQQFRGIPMEQGYRGSQKVLTWAQLTVKHNAKGYSRTVGALQDKLRAITPSTKNNSLLATGLVGLGKRGADDWPLKEMKEGGRGQAHDANSNPTTPVTRQDMSSNSLQLSGRNSSIVKRKNETPGAATDPKRSRLHNLSSKAESSTPPIFDLEPLRAKIGDLRLERERIKENAKKSEKQFRDCEAALERNQVEAAELRETMDWHENERNQHMKHIVDIRGKIKAVRSTINTMTEA